MEAESRASHESFRSWICFWRTGTPSAEVFLWTDSPLVISIFSWISFSCRAVSKAWSNNETCDTRTIDVHRVHSTSEYHGWLVIHGSLFQHFCK